MKKYIILFLLFSVSMTAGMYFFNEENLRGALFIGIGTSLLTTINTYFLDKKSLKKTK